MNRCRRSTQFDEQGYRGIIVPVPGHGSIAVLMHGSRRRDARDRRQIAAQVRDVRSCWTPEAPHPISRSRPSPSRSISRRALAASVGCIGLELHRDPFQTIRQRGVGAAGRCRRPCRSTMRLMSGRISLERLPGSRIVAMRIGQFCVQLGEPLA